MSKSKTFTVKYKRRRSGKTDYNNRIGHLKSEKIRIVIRTFSKNSIIQAVRFNDKGDQILFQSKASELRSIGWKYSLGNLPSSYLLGFYFGTKNKAKIKDVIIDLGIKKINERIASIIKGIVDSGLNVPHSKSIFPKDDKINGKIIEDYSKKLMSSNQELYKKQFSKYLKDGIKPEIINQEFEKIKNKILSIK